MDEPERTTLGGMPLFWQEAPGPFTAALELRVGQADETLPTRGITHLVEHLAIFGVGRVDHAHNGGVGATGCTIHASGEREEVLGFLQAVARSVHDLPFDRLPAERRILRSEDAGAPGVAARLLDQRFGAVAHGLVAYEELGLRWVGPREIERWAGGWFTAGNAALWMTGEPPADLDLGLPDGERRPDPVARPVPPAFPVHVADGTGGVALALWADRSVALRTAVAVLSDRLYDRLRREAGLGYAPYGDYDVVTGAEAHVLLGSDCEDHHAEAVQEQLWRAVHELAEAGPTAEELERHLERVRRNVEEPDAVPGALHSLARDELSGGRARPVSEWLAELEAQSGEAVAAALAAALPSAILLAPDRVGPPGDGFNAARVDEDEPVATGQEFRKPRSRLGRRAKARVVFGDERFTYWDDDGDEVTLLRADVVAGVREADGALTALARDGSWVTLTPSAWEEAEALEAVLLEVIGEDRLVPAAARETAEAVERLAQESGAMGDDAVRVELRDLPEMLHDAETPLAVVRATRGLNAGLLAVTTARFLWLFAHEEKGEVLDWPARDFDGADADPGVIVDGTLRLHRADGGRESFDVPKRAVDAVLAAAERAIGGAPG